MLNQNTDTYNDYLGENPVQPVAADANGVKSQFPVLMLSYCAPLFEYILHFKCKGLVALLLFLYRQAVDR
jgi:hypothetical protein